MNFLNDKPRDLSLTDNEKGVLGVIHRHALPISRPEVVESNELTFQSVSRIMKRLLELNLIQEIGIHNEGRGKPRICYKINQHFAYTSGIIFDHSFLSICVLDIAGNLIDQHLVHADFSQPQTLLNTVDELLNVMLKRNNIQRDALLGVGVSLPARIKDQAGQYLFGQKMQSWRDINVLHAFYNQLLLPVYLGNDAVNAAIGEYYQGVGKSGCDFYYLFIGHGIGSIYIKEGQPQFGSHGNAGEITLLFKGVQKPNTSLLKDFLATDGLVWDGVSELTIDILQSTAFSKWQDFCITEISTVLEMVIAILDPPAIVIGGTLKPELIQPIVTGLQLSNETLKQKIVFATDVQYAQAQPVSPSYGAAYQPLTACLYK